MHEFGDRAAFHEHRARSEVKAGAMDVRVAVAGLHHDVEPGPALVGLPDQFEPFEAR